jgi:hypothetical protein
MTGHQPIRQTWQCHACGRDWPCLMAQTGLRREYASHTVALHLYMAAAFAEACVDLVMVPAGDLYARFFVWLR